MDIDKDIYGNSCSKMMIVNSTTNKSIGYASTRATSTEELSHHENDGSGIVLLF